MARSLPWASPASRTGSRSPPISASIMSRPDTPSSSEATESILIPASSSTFDSRWPSEARCSISFLRYLVRARNAAT